MTPLRQRTHPETQWNTPACESCRTSGIDVVRTHAGSRLYKDIHELYPERSARELLTDVQADIEARVVACEHLAAEGPSIRVQTRTRPVIGDSGEIIDVGSPWMDEGVYIA